MYCRIYGSYLTKLRKIEAGLSQGPLGPVLYLIHTSDLPTSDNTTATFADDTAILAIHEDRTLHATIDKIDDWAKEMEN
jgi:hypothetical protein